LSKLHLKRIISTFLKPYKPTEYWLERGKLYQDKFEYKKEYPREEKVLIDYLKSFSFDTVLEFGCGFGRITKLLLENFQIRKYDAFDISPDQINNAKKLCKEFKNVNFNVSAIQDFESSDKYDLVLGFAVLLHVLPKDINDVIEKLVPFSNHHMINVDWHKKNLFGIQTRINAIHNYEKIYRNIAKVEVVNKKPIGKVSIFHAIMKQ